MVQICNENVTSFKTIITNLICAFYVMDGNSIKKLILRIKANLSRHDLSVDSAKLLKAEATRLRNTSWPLKYSPSFC